MGLETYNEDENNASSGEFLNELLQSYRNSLQSADQNLGNFLFETGRLLFYHGYYGEALSTFIKCHKMGVKLEDIEYIVFESYLSPNIDWYKGTYCRNVKMLKEYEHIAIKEFPDFEELGLYFIPFSDSKYAIYDKGGRCFVGTIENDSEKGSFQNLEEKPVCLFKNVIKTNSISFFEEKTRYAGEMSWLKQPIYLYYDHFMTFVQYLQLLDFSKLLETGRAVFIFGLEGISDYFNDTQTMLPTQMVNISGIDDPIYNKIIMLNHHRAEVRSTTEKELSNHYSNIDKNGILDKIKKGNPKILFFTSRFTTALQYYIRDCIQACEELQIPNRLLIEKSDMHRPLKDEWLRLLNEFKPDIVLGIDHYKWEFPHIPDNVFYITWEQDNLPHTMTKEAASKIKDMELIFNQQYDGIDKLIELGYPAEQMLYGPVPANPKIYKQYSLSESEMKQYETDLCYFSNTGNSRKGLAIVCEYYNNSANYERIKAAFETAYQIIFDMAYNEIDIYPNNAVLEVLEKCFTSNNLYFTSDEFLTEGLMRFKREVIYRLLREIPLLWLHDRGYKIKLYGAEWDEHPILNKYAMGIAQNGENLARVINASSIVLGINPIVTCHSRVVETMLCGGFYLCLNIPSKYDRANVRRYFSEDREIIIAYSKKDLYDKVDYYLAHPEERETIAKYGQTKALSSLTFERFINNVLLETGKWLEKKTKLDY